MSASAFASAASVSSETFANAPAVVSDDVVMPTEPAVDGAMLESDSGMRKSIAGASRHEMIKILVANGSGSTAKRILSLADGSRNAVIDAVSDMFPRLAIFTYGLVSVQKGVDPNVFNSFLAELGFESNVSRVEGPFLSDAEHDVLEFLINKAEEDPKFPYSHAFDSSLFERRCATPTRTGLCDLRLVPLSATNAVCMCCLRARETRTVKFETTANGPCTLCIDQVQTSDLDGIPAIRVAAIDQALHTLRMTRDIGTLRVALFVVQISLGHHCNCTVNRVKFESVLKCANGTSVFQSTECIIDGMASQAKIAKECSALAVTLVGASNGHSQLLEQLDTYTGCISHYMHDIPRRLDHLVAAVRTSAMLDADSKHVAIKKAMSNIQDAANRVNEMTTACLCATKNTFQIPDDEFPFAIPPTKFVRVFTADCKECEAEHESYKSTRCCTSPCDAAICKVSLLTGTFVDGIVRPLLIADCKQYLGIDRAHWDGLSQDTRVEIEETHRTFVTSDVDNMPIHAERLCKYATCHCFVPTVFYNHDTNTCDCVRLP